MKKEMRFVFSSWINMNQKKFFFDIMVWIFKDKIWSNLAVLWNAFKSEKSQTHEHNGRCVRVLFVCIIAFQHDWVWEFVDLYWDHVTCICLILACAVLRVSKSPCMRSQALYLLRRTQLYTHSPITSTHTLLFSHQVCSLYFISVISISKYLSYFIMQNNFFNLILYI